VTQKSREVVNFTLLRFGQIRYFPFN